MEEHSYRMNITENKFLRNRKDSKRAHCNMYKKCIAIALVFLKKKKK